MRERESGTKTSRDDDSHPLIKTSNNVEAHFKKNPTFSRFFVWSSGLRDLPSCSEEQISIEIKTFEMVFRIDLQGTAL